MNARSRQVVVIGSGIVGTAIAHRLAEFGFSVTVIEKGPSYPYPHTLQYAEQVIGLYDNPDYYLPDDLKNHIRTGDYLGNIERERFMVVGGTATRWGAATLRMIPHDFKTRTLFGVGLDWPIDYETLEPYYCDAETFLGVSGQPDDPTAGPRSSPFPLPAFDLSYGDRILRERLRADGILLHTTPQARTRADYGDRPSCVNHGTCVFCPTGARYSPNYHLDRLQSSGAVELLTNTSVRRILTDRRGDATAVLCQENDASKPFELQSKILITAAGAFENARLLLLSKGPGHPDGLGNASGLVGRNLTFHSEWEGMVELDRPIYGGRIGADTARTHQFMQVSTRGRHGGAIVTFDNSGQLGRINGRFRLGDATSGAEVVERMHSIPHRQPVNVIGESVPDPQKYVALSDDRDRFGDPFAHIHYLASDFDHETYGFARRLFERIERALGATESSFESQTGYGSGAHHMGTCSMGSGIYDSVVDSFGLVHGTRNVFIAGGAIFPGGNGAANPTLTMLALGFRTADYVRSSFGTSTL